MNNLCWNKEFAMGQVDNDEDLLQELIMTFKESSESDMAILIQAVEKGDQGRSPGH